MTLDDYITRDDTPLPDPNRCETCSHPEGHCDCQCCTEPFDPDRENDARRNGDYDDMDGE